ncbi:MAG: hypothetical protein ACI9KS_000686, partial [Sulfitobacter sp.]
FYAPKLRRKLIRSDPIRASSHNHQLCRLNM